MRNAGNENCNAYVQYISIWNIIEIKFIVIYNLYDFFFHFLGKGKYLVCLPCRRLLQSIRASKENPVYFEKKPAISAVSQIILCLARYRFAMRFDLCDQLANCSGNGIHDRHTWLAHVYGAYFVYASRMNSEDEMYATFVMPAVNLEVVRRKIFRRNWSCVRVNKSASKILAVFPANYRGSYIPAFWINRRLI